MSSDVKSTPRGPAAWGCKEPLELPTGAGDPCWEHGPRGRATRALGPLKSKKGEHKTPAGAAEDPVQRRTPVLGVGFPSRLSDIYAWKTLTKCH